MSDSDDYHPEAPRHYGPTTADNGSNSVLTETSPLLREPPTESRPRFPSMASTLADPSTADIEKPNAPPASPVSGQSSGSQHEQDTTIDSQPASSPVSTPSRRASSTGLRKRQRRVLKRLPLSLTLENSGSVARDHLASERTFLAYVRTSLAIASTGVAVVQLFTLSPSTTPVQQFARPLGATTVALAFIFLFIGFVRFFTIQSALTKGKFPVARVTVVGMALALAAVVVVVFAVIVAVAK